MFGRKKKDLRDLGDGLGLRLDNDRVSLIRTYGPPFPPDTIKEIRVTSPEQVLTAVLDLKAEASRIKDYRGAFEGAL